MTVAFNDPQLSGNPDPDLIQPPLDWALQEDAARWVADE